MSAVNTPKLKKPRGPEPERVKIEGMFWADAVAKALHTPAPAKASKQATKPKKRKK